MATHSQKVKVGIFFFVCVALLIAILILISGMQRFPTDIYYIKFRESVTGLDKGGDVRYNGVLVGRVTDINISAKGNVLVEVELRKDKLSAVRSGMTARLALRGITGIAYVELSGGGTGSVIPPGSTIPSELSFISNITTNFPRIVETLDQILLKLNLALGESETDFRENLSIAFQQVEKISDSSTKFFDQTTSQSIKITRRFDEFLDQMETSITETQKELEQVLKDMDNTVLRLDRRIAKMDLENTQHKINRMADGVTSTTREINLFLSRTDRHVSETELALLKSLRDLRNTLKDADDLINILKRDPSVLIHGPRPAGKQ